MRKKLFTIVLVILLSFAVILTGCTPQVADSQGEGQQEQQQDAQEQQTGTDEKEADTPEADSKEDDDETAFKAALVEVAANIFYDLIDSGVRDVVEANGGELLRSISDFDLQKELALVEDYLLQDIDVMFLSVVDPVGSVEAIRKCNEAGVPVICLASEPSPDEDVDIITYTKSDDTEAALEVAEYILEQINYSGDVLIIDGPQITCVLERVAGYKEVIDKYPDVNLVGHAIVDEHSVSGNIKLMENLLQAHPNTKAIFTYCGYGIQAADVALKNLGREDIWVGEVDGIPEECELLASGSVLGATIGQQPYQFGVKAAEAYLAYRENNSVDIPLWTKVEHVLITSENAGEWDAYDPSRNRYAE